MTPSGTSSKKGGVRSTGHTKWRSKGNAESPSAPDGHTATGARVLVVARGLRRDAAPCRILQPDEQKMLEIKAFCPSFANF